MPDLHSFYPNNRTARFIEEIGKGECLTEKWKHLQIVLPGEVNIISYCALASAHCRPVRGKEVLGHKI